MASLAYDEELSMGQQKKEIRQYHFLKTNPAGNTTIFVLDKTDPKDRSAIANELMRDERGLCAEQVAFLDSHPLHPADFSIAMMGGEFCGNATRSAAAWLVFDRERYQPSGLLGDKGQYAISCTGVDHPILCHVDMIGRTLFDVTADMPLPRSIEKVQVGRELFWKVDCDGIVHFIRFHTPFAEQQQVKKEWIETILEQFPTPHGRATGILFLEQSEGEPLDQLRLDPYVYVKDTDTLVHESSCGSGTSAAIAALSASLQKSMTADIKQRGGSVLRSEAHWANGALTFLSIGGTVGIIAEGMAYVEL